MIQFSVIVPTHNRPSQLHECLAALACQEFPKNQFEVIVVDDGGELSLEEESGVRFLRQPHTGPAMARNTGAAHACGRWLAFTDDDCRPASNWLTVLAGRLTQHPEHLLGGAVINLLKDNSYATASQQIVNYLLAYYNVDSNQPRFFTSNNMAVSAAAFDAVGGFDTQLTRAGAEDRELCDRWLHQHRLMSFVPEAIVHHSHTLTLQRFWRQHFRYGCGAYYYYFTHARRNHAPLRVEPWRFYTDLLRYPFTVVGPHPFRQATLVFLAQVANAFGYYTERFRALFRLGKVKYWENIDKGSSRSKISKE